jgi:hypothetical protein
MSESDRPRGEARPCCSIHWRLAAVIVAALAAIAAAVYLKGTRGSDLLRVEGLSVAPPVEKPRSEDEEALTRQLLASSVEVDLEAKEGAGDRLWASATLHQGEVGRQHSSHSEPIEALLAARADLRGLPLLAGLSCETSRDQAALTADACRSMRRAQANKLNPSAALRHWLRSRGEPPRDRDGRRAHDEPDRRLSPLHVRPLEQAIQIDEAEVRLELVRTLGKIDAKGATKAIARRAVFDTHPEVRKAAVEALRKRDANDAREVFLAAFRHPWPAAAAHAALALAALGDAGAAPALRALADEPDPRQPYRDGDGKWKQRRLVRVNHLRNCTLCHPPSISTEDVARGRVPRPGEPLPPPEEYYEPERPGGTPFRVVRADVTYFRQDFSLMHRVERPGKWPTVQRFDYLVQTREVDPVRAFFSPRQSARTHPQRQAARWALAALTRARP